MSGPVVPVPGPAADNHDAVGLEELAAEVARVRAERIAAERAAGELPTVLRAIELARRERDMGSSAVLVAHRADMERVMVDYEAVQRFIVDVQFRLQLSGLEENAPVARLCRRAVADGVSAVFGFAEAYNGEPSDAEAAEE